MCQEHTLVKDCWFVCGRCADDCGRCGSKLCNRVITRGEHACSKWDRLRQAKNQQGMRKNWISRARPHEVE